MSTTEAQRAKLAKIMDALVFYAWRVHYAQVRPMQTRSIVHLRAALFRRGGVTMDCSESVTLICRLAGLKDPNGLDYNGTGYTGTLLSHLPHYSNPNEARVGALAVFGITNAEPGGHHVCMVRHPGSDPVLYSHGSERDPAFHRLSYMRPGFAGAMTFLSIAELGR